VRPVTFAEFKDSFCYGTRSDLLHKWFKGADEEQVAGYLQEHLRLSGDLLDDGDPGPLIDLLFDMQQRAYSTPSGRPFEWEYADAPFAPLGKPLREATVALLTTTGHFVAGDDPQPFGVVDMSQEEAERRINEFPKHPIHLAEIPAETATAQLRVRHGGFDTRGAIQDPNVVFPLEHLRALAAAGEIGAVAPRAFSFVGNVSQVRLLKESGPEWVERLRADGADGALLVPG
jgi:D-proline reductase (dithiol) PrdB